MQNKTQATACYSVLSDDFFSDDHWVVQDILSDEFFADDHWVTQDLFSDEFFSDDFWKTKKRKKNTVNPLDNETRNFLFDPTKNQYEKIRKSLVNYYKKKDLYYLAPADSAEDVVSEFLVHVCEKDKFKGNTETLKMGNVIYIFRQFLSRERMAKSKCGLYRSKDVKAKTDQEQRLEKEGKTLRKVKKSYTEVKEVQWGFDEETGVADSFEVASHYSNPEQEAEANETLDIVFEEFASASENLTEASRLYDVFVGLAERSYRTDQAFADNLGVELSELKRLKFKVKNTIKNSSTLREMYS